MEEGRGANCAYVETVPVEVTDGKFKITFTSNIENPQINAIEILPQSAAGPAAPTPTSPQTTPAPSGTGRGAAGRGAGGRGGRGPAVPPGPPAPVPPEVAIPQAQVTRANPCIRPCPTPAATGITPWFS